MVGGTPERYVCWFTKPLTIATINLMKPQIHTKTNYHLANYWAPPCTMVMVMVFFYWFEPP